MNALKQAAYNIVYHLFFWMAGETTETAKDQKVKSDSLKLMTELQHST